MSAKKMKVTGWNSAPLWNYIHERELIRLAKLAGKPWPWTADAILQRFKFTNVKRLHDRTTQAFLRAYTANAAAEPHVALYNCAVRRFFGTEEFSETAGWLPGHSVAKLRAAEKKCPKPWTGAYMIRAGARGVPKVEVVADYLAGLWKKAKAITAAIESTGTWEAGYRIMQTCHGFGGAGFMCKEVLQDYILWLHLRRDAPLKDEETWTPVGPGGRRGLNRLAGRETGANPPFFAMLEEVREHLAVIQPLWLKTFPEAERLTAHDIQFCLCEFDKYERTRLGEGRPRSKYQARPEHLKEKH